MTRPLRIAHVAPPLERVPPLAYGGTERIVYELVVELDRRGHEVTTFASGDSEVPGRLVPTVAEALRPEGYMRRPDALHAGHDATGPRPCARVRPDPQPPGVGEPAAGPRVARCRSSRRSTAGSTSRGRREALRDPPAGWSRSARTRPPPTPTSPGRSIHNGLTLTDAPFERRRGEALCFVGRVAPEKGIVEAIEIAKLAGRPLRIAAKVAPDRPSSATTSRASSSPPSTPPGQDVEFLGELTQSDRDDLFAESFVSLMPGAWPEPFGLVAIESLACGTPVIARRIGALPEIIRDGVDGFFGDDVTQMAFKVEGAAELDRAAIRESVLERFSAGRMTDGYEALYRRMLGIEGGEAGGDDDGRADVDEPTQLGPRVASREQERRTAIISGG